LLALENTHNSRGGLAIAPSSIVSAARAASELGVPVHLDGARLFNAAVAQGVDVAEFTDAVDSVLVCLSKGLGAPVGSVVAGSTEFVREAERVRQLFGGGMRQAGVIAGPALVALRNRTHLSTDHRNATELAAGLDGLRGLSTKDPETNIVLLDTTGTNLTAATFAERLNQHGVGVTVFGDETVRFVTHKNISEEDIDTVVRAAKTVLAAA
jgi:threonine aldolase